MSRLARGFPLVFLLKMALGKESLVLDGEIRPDMLREACIVLGFPAASADVNFREEHSFADVRRVPSYDIFL